MKKSIWLAVFVGWFVQLGLKTFLPIVVMVGMRAVSLAFENDALWLEHPDDTTHSGWYAIQISIVLGSMAAGALAALLSPRMSKRVVVALVMLSLLATFFEQYPRPLTEGVRWIWMGGPCLGLVVGFVLVRLLERRRAFSPRPR